MTTKKRDRKRYCKEQSFGKHYSESSYENNLGGSDFTDNWWHPTQAAITCSKLTIETLDQGVKYVPS